MARTIQELSESIQTGFIDKNINSQADLRPQLLTNDKVAGKKVLSVIERELNQCDEFWFSVAFITTSGVATLMNTFLELKERGIKGKILTSQYLNFTHPQALKRLTQFDNIELKIAVSGDFHSKGYLFKKNDLYDLIIGSSNLTSTALCLNKEWNLKISASKNSDLIAKTLIEFEKEFELAKRVDDKYIEEYNAVYKKNYKYYKELVEKRDQEKLDFPTPNEMQKEALANIAKLRAQDFKKALLISATGTGKTYLSAFDVHRVNPKKFLFIVHRANIALAALKSYKSLFGNTKKMGLYSGNVQELEADYLFATIQLLSRDEHLHKFSPTEFDYIVIDETHRAGAESYKKIMDYFKPQYMLGMTATPERTDGIDIYKLFDNIIAYEIRLHRALDEQMLSPFHYYGITDIYVDGRPLDDNTEFSNLVTEQRVQHIISKIETYGTDTGEVRGLVFCSRVDESSQLAKMFNDRGIRCIALSGNDSEEERAKAIQRLESSDEDKLDYIFTVDIFNEGVDIPAVNQIILLRPTQSAIIFVQQLGRGLRKAENKEYLTVIDFIGNYSNDYLVPIALYGDNSYNKDTIRKLMASGSNLIPGASTVNFDRIAKDRIFEAINSANLNLLADLKKDFNLLKYKLGKTPLMVDFLNHGSRDPWAYVESKGSYFNFLCDVEQGYDELMPEKDKRLIQYLSKEVNNGKKVEDSILLLILLTQKEILTTEFVEVVKNETGIVINQSDIDSCIHNINLLFPTVNNYGTLVRIGEVIGYKLVEQIDTVIKISTEFSTIITNKNVYAFIKDNTEYSIKKFKIDFKISSYFAGFILYRKYSRKDVFRILKWDKNPNAQTVGGYMVSPGGDNCAIFVTYHKNDDISDTIKFQDRFISPDVLQWMSKSNRNLQSPDVKTILGEKGPIRLPLFVKKSDGEGTDFYYMGDLFPIINETTQTTMPGTNGEPLLVVQFKLILSYSVEENIYDYITNDKI